MGKHVINHYKAGRYDNEQMKIFVKVNWITIAEYEEVTGVKYVV